MRRVLVMMKKTSMNMRKPMADVAQAFLVAGGLLVEKKLMPLERLAALRSLIESREFRTA